MNYFYFTVSAFLFLIANANAEEINPARPPVAKSFMSDLGIYLSEATNSLAHILEKPKNLIKAVFEVPKPLTTDDLVPININENFCIENNIDDFMKRLSEQTDLKSIEKIIFCPNSPALIKQIDLTLMLTKIKPELYEAFISTLILRKKTLSGLYSKTFVDSNYSQCFNGLWEKITNKDSAASEHWPCETKNCECNYVKDQIISFANTNESCKSVLKDQLIAYADRVVEAIVKAGKIESSELREAILETLRASPHFSVAFNSLIDVVYDLDREAAIAKIDSILSDFKQLMVNNKSNSTCLNDAEFKANERFSKINNQTKETSSIEKVSISSTTSDNKNSAVEAPAVALLKVPVVDSEPTATTPESSTQTKKN